MVDGYARKGYLSLSESISNNAVYNMNHREHEDEYMQLVDSISRYKSHLPLRKNPSNRNQYLVSFTSDEWFVYIYTREIIS